MCILCTMPTTCCRCVCTCSYDTTHMLTHAQSTPTPLLHSHVVAHPLSLHSFSLVITSVATRSHPLTPFLSCSHACTFTCYTILALILMHSHTHTSSCTNVLVHACTTLAPNLTRMLSHACSVFLHAGHSTLASDLTHTHMPTVTCTLSHQCAPTCLHIPCCHTLLCFYMLLPCTTQT